MNAKANPTPLRVIRGQPSYLLGSDRVELAVTRTGGQLGPVVFRLGKKKISPLNVAPWAEESVPAGTPAILRVLRGDFFCAPFGGNAQPWRGEQHPPHGDSANLIWKRADAGVGTRLRLTLDLRVRPGQIEKLVELRPGETNVYQRHTIHGAAGPMCLGHHAMLAFPPGGRGGLVSTSRLLRGQVAPRPFESPAQGGYQALKPGAMFRRLDRVPQLDGGVANLSRYPAREGFDDLVMLVHEATGDFAWNAVVFPDQGYVWFALKNPRHLRATLLWHSNGGRHYAPWNSRHRGVLGVEDVTAYFHYGLAESAQANPVNRAGFPTAVKLDPLKPLVIPYIFGIAAVPPGFGAVRAIHREKNGIVLVATTGGRVAVKVDHGFLRDPD